MFESRSEERAVNILARRLDGRKDIPDLVSFSNFLCTRSGVFLCVLMWEVLAGAMQSERSQKQG